MERGVLADEMAWAAYSGDVDLMRQHLDNGTSHMDAVRCVGPWFGETCLHLASKGGHLEVVKELVRRGANLNAGRRPLLDLACGSDKAEVVKFLVDSGARLDIGRPLSIVCRRCRHALAGFLLDRGASVDGTSDTPLLYTINSITHEPITDEATLREKEAKAALMVRFLLERGAAVDDAAVFCLAWTRAGPLAALFPCSAPAITRLREHWLRRIHFHVVGPSEGHANSARHGLVDERGLMRLVVCFLAPGRPRGPTEK